MKIKDEEKLLSQAITQFLNNLKKLEEKEVENK